MANYQDNSIISCLLSLSSEMLV